MQTLLARHLEHLIRLTPEAPASTHSPQNIWELRLRHSRAATLRILQIETNSPLTEVRGVWHALEATPTHYVVRLEAKQVSGQGTAIGARLWQDLRAPLCLRVTAEDTIAEVSCPAAPEPENINTPSARPSADDFSVEEYAHLLIGHWLTYHFSSKTDEIYFERFAFAEDGTAQRERWKQIDQMDDDEKHAYVSVRGTYRFIKTNAVRFEPETPDGESVELHLHANFQPRGDVHLRLPLSGVPNGYKRFERER